jgi:serine/threonine-protein kinase
MKTEGDKAPDDSAGLNESEAKEVALCDAYLDALSNGRPCSPEDFLAQYPDGNGLLGELRAIVRLVDLADRVREDSRVEALPEEAITEPEIVRPEQPFLPIPKTIGSYQLDCFLGRGGMGEVYKAQDPAMHRWVAIKMLLADMANDPHAVERFKREIMACGQAGGHQNLAIPFLASEHGGQPFLVMEYVEGKTLSQVVKETGPLPWREACNAILQAARGLKHLHVKKVIHRDIKPSNLMRTPEGVVKVVDLGLARRHPEQPSLGDSSLTPTGAILGTVDYLAPEQASDSAAADHRSDLYSLGCTFYFLLTGKAPFHKHASKVKKVVAHHKEQPTPVQELEKDVPEAIANIVIKLLKKEPEDRYQSASELINQLTVAMSQKDVAPEPDCGAVSVNTRPAVPRKRSWWSRKSVLAVAAIVLLLGGIVLYVFWPQAPAHLQRMDFFAGPPESPARWELVKNGKELDVGVHPSLGADDYFKLSGQFDRATGWSLVWIDTNGTASLIASSAKGRNVEYPSTEDMDRVNPKDPKGVHLILLLSGPLPASAIQHDLAGLGAPPNVEWAGMLRGVEGAPKPAQLPLDYLRKVASQLPAGVEPVYALFLRTG